MSDIIRWTFFFVSHGNRASNILICLFILFRLPQAIQQTIPPRESSADHPSVPEQVESDPSRHSFTKPVISNRMRYKNENTDDLDCD